jgi:Na+/H+ antiporter NhaD/arsenite permease-like protein
VLPFVALLLLIATGPLFFAKFWHRYYKIIAVLTGLVVAGSYVFLRHETLLVAETFAEYISFISLLLSLYVAAGGVYIFADFESKAKVNILFLLAGAVLTNFIGTTGASVLLIRPYMRVNRYRLKPYHIVFFIFLISNVGGALTPIGDPPLFMGFLKGVPFFWPLINQVMPWSVVVACLLTIFWFFEKGNTALDEVDVSAHYTNRIKISGKQNFIWLGLIIASVFIDPNVIEGVPYIDIHGKRVSFIRELSQFAIAFGCYRKANQKAMKSNEFSFEPISEVAFLFFGIFMAMIPALQLLEASGKNAHLAAGFIYWSTGLFSSLLDNAPTYINFFTLAMSMDGLSASNASDVVRFISGKGLLYVSAISAASVFFGAMTYIGNGPNFMVKAIAEQQGVKMPGFFAYIFKYTVPVLLPVLIVVWLLFFI